MPDSPISNKRANTKLRKRTSTLTRQAHDLSVDCAVDVLLIIGKRGSRYKIYSSLQDRGTPPMASIAVRMLFALSSEAEC